MTRNDLTINECLSLMKAVRERINGLKQLRLQVSIKETYFGDMQKTVEPQYDIKAIDRKVMELENFLFKADARIKAANAKTILAMEIDIDALLAPLGE